MLTDFIASYNTAIAQGATVTFINIPNKLQDRIILDKGLSTEQVKNIDQNGIWTKTTFFGNDILISGNVPNVIPGIVYVKDTDTLLSGPYTGWADFIIALMVNTMVDDEHRECIKQRERRRAMSEKGRAVRKQYVPLYTTDAKKREKLVARWKEEEVPSYEIERRLRQKKLILHELGTLI